MFDLSCIKKKPILFIFSLFLNIILFSQDSKSENLVPKKEVPSKQKENQSLNLQDKVESVDDNLNVLDEKKSYDSEIQQTLSTAGVRGNWVVKKMLLIKAAGYLSDIANIKKEIFDAKTSLYLPKIEEISNLLKSFRLIAPGQKEDLTSSIANLQDKTDLKLNEVVELSRDADQKNFSQGIRYKLYDAEEKYALNKEKLSKLKMDVDFVDDLQKSFDNRVTQLNKSIEKADEIFNQAETIVDQMSKMHDHRMAEEKCFLMENLVKNIQIVKSYVKVDAFKLFDSEQSSLGKEVARLKTELSAITADIEKLDKDILEVQKNLTLVSESNDKKNEKIAEPIKSEKVEITPPKNKVEKPLSRGYFSIIFDIWDWLLVLLGFK